MAYTYDDFLSYLPMAGLTEQDFSPEDLRLAQQNPQAGVALLDAKFDWKNAQTDDERALANAKANQVRSQYGYSGGIDGMNGNVSLTPDDIQTSLPQPGQQGQGYATDQPTSQPQQTSFTPTSYTPPPAPQYNAPAAYNNPYAEQQQGLLNDMTNYKPFEYGNYNNQYSAQQQQLLNDLTNYGPFSFDADTNPQMQAYTKKYAREGNRAMQDTLGSLSAATGGRPSTAAMSAASQANDYYMAQLGDMLPQIYESEYNKYLQDFNMMGQKLGAVNEMEGVDYSRYWDGKNFDYGKYLDDYSRMQGNLGAVNELAAQDRGDYESDRNYGLDYYGLQLGQYNTDRNFGYGQTYDAANWQRDAEQTAYNRQQYADETAYNRQADQWDREYKFTQADRSAQQTEYNQMMDMWKSTGRANNAIAEYFGVNVGALYGGAETELALEQARANIEQTNKETAYIGTSTGTKGGTAPISNAQINAAYDRVRAGNGAGADIALLKDAGWTASELSALTGGTDGPDGTDGNAIDAAIDRLYGGTGTQNDIQTLIDAGYDPNDLKDEFPDMFGGPATDWRDAYDEASLTQYKIQTEDDIQKLLDKGYYTLEMNANGKLKIRRISH